MYLGLKPHSYTKFLITFTWLLRTKISKKNTSFNVQPLLKIETTTLRCNPSYNTLSMLLKNYQG